jgi:hypothetical protein
MPRYGWSNPDCHWPSDGHPEWSSANFPEVKSPLRIQAQMVLISCCVPHALGSSNPAL